MLIDIIGILTIGIVFTLLMLIAFMVGASRAKKQMLMALEFAAQHGDNFKLSGRAHKIVLTSKHLELVRQADQNTAWSWQYANGKQR